LDARPSAFCRGGSWSQRENRLPLVEPSSNTRDKQRISCNKLKRETCRLIILLASVPRPAYLVLASPIAKQANGSLQGLKAGDVRKLKTNRGKSPENSPEQRSLGPRIFPIGHIEVDHDQEDGALSNIPEPGV